MEKAKQRLLYEWKSEFQIFMWSFCKYKNAIKNKKHSRHYIILHLTTACESYDKLQKFRYFLGWKMV